MSPRMDLLMSTTRVIWMDDVVVTWLRVLLDLAMEAASSASRTVFSDEPLLMMLDETLTVVSEDLRRPFTERPLADSCKLARMVSMTDRSPGSSPGPVERIDDAEPRFLTPKPFRKLSIVR